MKKVLRKIISITIGTSLISGSIAPAFASDTGRNNDNITNVQTQTTAKPLLTLDQAIKSAISSSEILALDEKKISYTDKINDLNEKIDDNPQLVGKAEIAVPDNKKDLDKDTHDVQLKQCKQQRDFDQDKITQKVTTVYNDMVTDQIKIDKLEKDINLKNIDLNIKKVENDEGITTPIDVESNSISLEDLQDKLKSSESALKDAEYNFKVLTGKDATQYSLEGDIKYDVFKIDGSVDEYIDNIVEDYLSYSTQIVELNRDYINDSDNKVADVDDKDKPTDTKPVLSISDVNTDLGVVAENLRAYEDYESNLDKYYQERYMYTFKLSNRLAYLNAKLRTYESETNLDETKKQFKEQLRSLYTMLTTIEDNINLLKRNIEMSNKQLRILKVKYDSGLATKSDYDHQVVNSEELDIQLRCAIDRYNILKEEIQKPWIVFSN